MTEEVSMMKTEVNLLGGGVSASLRNSKDGDMFVSDGEVFIRSYHPALSDRFIHATNIKTGNIQAFDVGTIVKRYALIEVTQ